MNNLSDQKNLGETKEHIQDALKAALVIHSIDLFGPDGNLVIIQHANHWYRLMLTKQGKLILTK